MAEGGKKIIPIERESVISTLKPRLIGGLSELIVNDMDKQEFLIFCTRVEATIRAWYNRQFEEMKQLFMLFDPVDGQKKLEKQNLSPSQVENLEDRFLSTLFNTMDKSQYKLLSDAELKAAKEGHYLLDLPILVDHNRLDHSLLARYFKNHPLPDLPSYTGQYLIFRRGVGVDRTTGLFPNEKIDTIIIRIWHFLLTLVRLRKPDPKITMEAAEVLKKSEKSDPNNPEHHFIERLRLQTMSLRPKNLFGKVTIQEPTFDRIIVVYRKATPPGFPSDLGNRNIAIMHFHDIPMADMEVVLPEKKTPSLAPQDWLRFLITAVGGFYALFASLKSEINLVIVGTFAAAFAGYFSRVYFAWQASMAKYNNLITQSMYSKHLDSGRGTILHLCDDVIQQEVKEVIVAYFLLMTQGKATIEELDHRCEELMLEEFKEDLDFDVDGSVEKLRKLKIVTKSAGGHYTHQSLKSANDIIGVTTDEIVQMADE